jgi:DNA polymerase bacteriophage-type
LNNLLFLDFETFSTVDIKQHGRSRYVEKCEILIVAWAMRNHCVSTIVPSLTRGAIEPLIKLLLDPKYKVVAHNAEFERAVLGSSSAKSLGLPPLPVDRFICTMELAGNFMLPRSLARCAQALGVQEKMDEGKHLISWFCSPRRPSKNDPSTRRYMTQGDERTEQFIEYAKRDIEVCRDIWNKLGEYYEQN